jgi:hypothetical protein
MKFFIVFLWFFVSIVSCNKDKKSRYDFTRNTETRCELVMNTTNSTKENITSGLFYRLTPVQATNEECKKVCSTYNGCKACFNGDIIPSCGQEFPTVQNWTLHYWSRQSQVYHEWNELSADNQTSGDYPFNNATTAPCSDFQFKQFPYLGKETCLIKVDKTLSLGTVEIIVGILALGSCVVLGMCAGSFSARLTKQRSKARAEYAPVSR